MRGGGEKDVSSGAKGVDGGVIRENESADETGYEGEHGDVDESGDENEDEHKDEDESEDGGRDTKLLP